MGDPLEALLVDGEAEVAAGRGRWASQEQKIPRDSGDIALLNRLAHQYERDLFHIIRAQGASAERLREMAAESRVRGRSMRRRAVLYPSQKDTKAT